MRQTPSNRRGRGRGNGRKPVSRHHTFDSNGPSVRVRGTAPQLHEKYLALARDAAASGDRIMAENYYQHADHYYRVLNASSQDQVSERGSQRRGAQPPDRAKAQDAEQDAARSNGRQSRRPRGNGKAEAEFASAENRDGADGAEVPADVEPAAPAADDKPSKAPRLAKGGKSNGAPAAEAEEPVTDDKDQPTT